MIKNRKKTELFKSALILLLTVSALLLGWQTKLFNDFFGSIPLFGSVAELVRGTASTVETNGAPIKEAARPLVIVITDEQGEHFAVKYDTDWRNAVYDRTSSIIGEALGSALMVSEISEAEWREALLGHGVYFEYVFPVRLSVLGGWLGSPMPDLALEAPIRRLCVVFGEERNRLYFQDANSGQFYGAETASAAAKAQELEIYSPNSAIFAFQLGTAGSESAPYMMIFPGRSYHPDVRADSVGSATELLEITRDAMGHANESTMIFPEGEGALRCIGTNFNLRADLFGRVTYRRLDDLTPYAVRLALSEGDLIERARIVVAETIGAFSGGAEVFFESVDFETAGYGSVYFGYYIAGGRVHLQNDMYAAKVTIANGIVTLLELNFLNFAFSGEYSRLLPEVQALAARNGEFILSYSDIGAEILQSSWLKFG